MQNENEKVTVIYDRKKEVQKKGYGKVEIRIYLPNRTRKYVSVRTCDPFEWKEYQKSTELREQIAIYKHVIRRMEEEGEALTIDNINLRIGIDTPKTREHREIQQKKSSKTGFIDFITLQLSKEQIKHNTIKRRYVVMGALERFGKLNSFTDLTPKNIKAFDDFLHEEDSSRTQPTIHDYHKVLKHYTRLAADYDYIENDPYEHPLCHFERGKSKERNPLTEEELIRIRKCKLGMKEDRVRDLFIFCAYTGLSYIDSQNFDYETMTETINGQTYIDGERIKTGNRFYTPILPPAMAVLKKYDYKLPHISNQKANDYLDFVEIACNIHKPLTMHVARHSFATLALSYDIPIEDVARMMGHSNIRTTQVYAKILKSTIERHASNLASLIK